MVTKTAPRESRDTIMQSLCFGMTVFVIMMSIPAVSEATYSHHHSGHHGSHRYYRSAYHHGFHGYGFHGHHYPYHHFPGDSRFSDEISKQERDNVDSPSGSTPFGALGRGIGGLVRVITFGKVKFPSRSNPPSLVTQQETANTTR